MNRTTYQKTMNQRQSPSQKQRRRRRQQHQRQRQRRLGLLDGGAKDATRRHDVYSLTHAPSLTRAERRDLRIARDSGNTTTRLKNFVAYLRGTVVRHWQFGVAAPTKRGQTRLVVRWNRRTRETREQRPRVGDVIDVEYIKQDALKRAYPLIFEHFAALGWPEQWRLVSAGAINVQRYATYMITVVSF